jgi:hypothetical protein
MTRLAWLLAVVVGCGEVTKGADGGGGDDPNDPPTAVDLSAASVEEQAPPGTRVGLLTAVDADASDQHTFELIEDGGGLFAISGDRLEVAPGAIPNYETGASIDVTVVATDEAGLSVEAVLAIEILDLREVVNTLNDGDGSLRQNIADAEPGETILFETGLDPSISVNGALLLTKNVTIRGPLPPAEIVLDALENNRVFEISVAANVTLQNLRLRGGSASSGGAIQNQGMLVIERSIIEDSIATGTGQGGAILNSGTLTARDSLFQRNHGFNGGAISANSVDGTTIERCSFLQNETTGNSGGAIVGGYLKVINSTFFQNVASDASQDRVGGAIALGYPNNEIAFSTISGNSADGPGGGIYCAENEDGPITLLLRGSIVAGNGAPGAPDVSIETGCTLIAENSAISDADGNTAIDGEDGNVVGTAIPLGEPGDNGGLTPTMVPDDGVPSIDLVPGASCTDLEGAALEVDQRGEARPGGESCDAGSLEEP